MTPSEHKLWHWMQWGVKGKLFDDAFDVDTMKLTYDSYFKRMWGNHEFMQVGSEHDTNFEDAYNERFGTDPSKLAERLPDHQRRSLRSE